MKQKGKVKRIIQMLGLCMAVILLLSTPTINAYASGNQCEEASCTGTYDNGFCTKCGDYETPKQVSDTHYSQLNSTHNGYYAIENAGQLYWFAEYVNSGNATTNGVLVADITVNENVLDSNGQLNTANTSGFKTWIPIGQASLYKGTFDGQNHKISGLYCVDVANYVGLFGYINSATVKNVGVVDSYMCGSDGADVGAIAAFCLGSDITNCYNAGNIAAKGECGLGGITGYIDSGNITDCYNVGDISVIGAEDNVYLSIGGIAGRSFNNSITNCHNTGDITATEDYYASDIYLGGVVGDSYNCDIIGCYNTGAISVNCNNYTANASVAGIAGYIYYTGDEASVVENCYNTGDVTVKFADEVTYGDVAGLVGNSGIKLINCYNSGDIYGEFAAYADWAEVGGLVAYGYESEIINCFNVGMVTACGDGINVIDSSVFCGAIAGDVAYTNITNTYYNSDICSGDAVGNTGDECTTENVSGMTTEQFESGEVAYLLNGSRSEGTEEEPLVWYQTTGSDGVPTLDSTHKVVYYEDGKYGNEWPEITVSYRTHIQTFGWEKDWKSNGTMSGTSGKSKRLEGINIVVSSSTEDEDLDLGIQYTTHCQSYGWLPWSANGEMNGTEGEAKRLEAIMIQLTGKHADLYDVYYRVHAQTYGWLGWAKNGAPAGTAGYAKRLEGIQIVVVKKGESINQTVGNITSARSEAFVAKEGNSPIVNYPATSNTNPVVPGDDIVNVAYRTHVQKYGWQAWKYNGQMSGTSGESKRLEGINIELRNQDCSGDIVYTTHVQKYGWQGSLSDQSTWKKNGEMSGTSGEAKRLEAICINLTGEMAANYDIYYRVHAQSYGWLGWAKNGAPAGTAGYGKRLEGIQIVLVPKGGAAPTAYQGITSANASAYIEK